jgi:hypothetical protein
MFKKIIVIVAVLLIAGSIFSTDAFAGPPWPAEVFQIREGEFCWFTWLNDNFEVVNPTGTGMWTVQYLNGQLQWNCHTVLDFSSPDIASTAEVCAAVEALGLDLCNGDGSFRWEQTYEPLPNICGWADAQGNEYFSDASHTVVSPSGQVNISCHFDLSP